MLTRSHHHYQQTHSNHTHPSEDEDEDENEHVDADEDEHEVHHQPMATTVTPTTASITTTFVPFVASSLREPAALLSPHSDSDERHHVLYQQAMLLHHDHHHDNNHANDEGSDEEHRDELDEGEEDEDEDEDEKAIKALRSLPPLPLPGLASQKSATLAEADLEEDVKAHPTTSTRRTNGRKPRQATDLSSRGRAKRKARGGFTRPSTRVTRKRQQPALKPTIDIDSLSPDDSNPLDENDQADQAQSHRHITAPPIVFLPPVTNSTPSAKDKLKIHRCDKEGCGKGFARKSDLIRHFRIHSDDKPFPCDICGKSFIQASALKVHNRTHTGEKPYNCPDEGCDKSFADSSSLLRHRRTHTGERPYICHVDGCEKAFCRNITLVKHQARMHDMFPLTQHGKVYTELAKFLPAGQNFLTAADSLEHSSSPSTSMVLNIKSSPAGTKRKRQDASSAAKTRDFGHNQMADITSIPNGTKKPRSTFGKPTVVAPPSTRTVRNRQGHPGGESANAAHPRETVPRSLAVSPSTASQHSYFSAPELQAFQHGKEHDESVNEECRGNLPNSFRRSSLPLSFETHRRGPSTCAAVVRIGHATHSAYDEPTALSSVHQPHDLGCERDEKEASFRRAVYTDTYSTCKPDDNTVADPHFFKTNIAGSPQMYTYYGAAIPESTALARYSSMSSFGSSAASSATFPPSSTSFSHEMDLCERDEEQEDSSQGHFDASCPQQQSLPSTSGLYQAASGPFANDDETVFLQPTSGAVFVSTLSPNMNPPLRRAMSYTGTLPSASHSPTNSPFSSSSSIFNQAQTMPALGNSPPSNSMMSLSITSTENPAHLHPLYGQPPHTAMPLLAIPLGDELAGSAFPLASPNYGSGATFSRDIYGGLHHDFSPPSFHSHPMPLMPFRDERLYSI